MKILRLEAENFKRLSAVEITPQGNLVRIAGKNNQGKSSILDSIAAALAGADAIDWEPVRQGEERAHITLDLGTDEGGLKLRVTRKFKAKQGDKGSKPYTTDLIVEDADGRRPRGPQELLNTIVGAIALDPLAFSLKDDKGKVAILRGLVTGVDWDGIAAARLTAYEERTLASRRAHESHTRATGIIVPPNAPDQPVDVAALTERLTKINEQEAAVNQAAINRRKLDARDEAAREGLTRTARMIAELETAAAEYKAEQNQVATLKRGLVDLPAPEDRAPVVADINMASELNAAYARKEQREQVEREAKEWAAKAEALTEQIEGLDKTVADAIAAAELPVRGLTFDDDGVYLDAVPFAQAADSLKLRASMAVAMAMAPNLRVLRIKQGGLLDEDAMKLIGEVAAADDYQMWIERVEDDAPAAIQIADGRIAK